MRGYGIRPRSAISRASIRCNRPRAPSLAARGDGSTSREMEVLMRICEDQGTSCLLNPTDFDSRQVTPATYILPRLAFGLHRLAQKEFVLMFTFSMPTA